MRTRPQLLAVFRDVAANYRKPWVIAALTLALSSLALWKPALAQCAGPLDNVVCTTSGNTYSTAVPGNPYQQNAGINVGGGPNDVLNVTLASGVKVEIPLGFGGINA